MATDQNDTERQLEEAARRDADDGNDFLLVLSQFNKGRLLGEINDKLSDLLAAIGRYEKKGSLTIKFDFEPGPEQGTVKTKASVDAKAPQPEHYSIHFVDQQRGHKLRRDDPNAIPLF